MATTPLRVKYGDKKKVAWRVNTSLLNSTAVLSVTSASGVTLTPTTTIEDFQGGIVSWKLDGTLAVGVYAVKLTISTGAGDSLTVVTAPTVGTALLQVNA